MRDLTRDRILVTGGNGFLGRKVVQTLRARGAGHIFTPRSSEYDLRDRDAIQACLRDLCPNVVIHLAAVVGGIGANAANPASFFYDNAIMGIELIEQSRLAGIEKFVQVGTVCSYPKFAPAPFQEDGIWDGYPEETNAPYGLAKKMLLVQAQAYRQQYGFNAIYLIPVNLYGPGDNFDPESSHVIPALIRKFIEAKERGDQQVVAWGTGRASREFLYVDDAADGIVRATTLYDGAEPVNLGTGQELTIASLTRLVAGLCDYEGEIVWDESRPDGQPKRQLDVSRARELFGFEAATGFEDGLRRTIEWYKMHRAALLEPAVLSR
jgi:GDP-L-fucose synthase